MVAEASSRDYAADFWAFIEVNLPDKDYRLPEESVRLVRLMEAVDQDLLIGWLKQQAVRLLYDVLEKRERDQRLSNRNLLLASYFRDLESDPTRKDVFDTLYVVDGGLRRRLGEMTAADHLFVAKQREVTGRTLLFHAALHRAIAKRLPDGKKTADVFDEAAYVLFVRTFDA